MVRDLADRSELNNKLAPQFLDDLAKTAPQETQKQGVFVLAGLGRLAKSNRKARMGRNPATSRSGSFLEEVAHLEES